MLNKIILFFIALTCFHCKSTQPNLSTATLENTYWKLTEVDGKSIVTPANEKEVHMILTSEGNEKRVKGFAGCNQMGGSFIRDGNKIQFNTLSTKMFCHDRMDVEDQFFKVLSNTDTYTIKGEELYLYQGNTKLASFSSVYLK